MCAWRYKQEWFEDGDVTRPEDWLDNVSEIANELNGYLDSDNFRELSLGMEHVKQKAFNSFLTYGEFMPWDFDYNFPGWTARSNSESGDLATVKGEVANDALYIIEFGCRWSWERDFSSSYNVNNEFGDRIHRNWHHVHTCVRFRLVANNTVVAESGWSSNTMVDSSLHLTAAIPLPAGSVVVRAEMQVAVASGMAPFTDFYSVGHKVSESDQVDYDRGLTVYDRELIVNIRKR
jgi:hypothetical protein